MRIKKVGVMAIKDLVMLVVLGTGQHAVAQDATTAYPKMAPIEQYLIPEQSAEIALARTAAPESISHDAEVRVLGRHGYETAVQGKNGFVCIVGRGWSSAPDADFWNPKVRVPMCVNAPAARTYLLRINKITKLALAGRTPTQVNEGMAGAIAKKELPAIEAGAMCYMMGKEGYGGDVIPHWPSHLMFFYSQIDAAIWGANLAGSPVLGMEDAQEQLTQFVIPVQRWSDGTEVPAATSAGHEHR